MPRHQDAGIAMVFALAFTISIFGILTRPLGGFAGFWPANAVTLALLVRYAAHSRLFIWLAAFSGFVTADIMAGDAMIDTLALTLANFCGIAIGYAMLVRFPMEIRQFCRGSSVLALLAVAICAASATAVMGAGVSVLTHGSIYSRALMLWFSSELVNYVTIMPFILTLPEDLGGHLTRIGSNFSSHNWERRCLGRLLAVTLMIGSCYLGQSLGGPGALLFPLPALLFIAMVFSVSTTGAVLLIYALWCNAALSLDTVDMGIPLSTVRDQFSMRLGMAFLSLGPLTVASMNVARTALLVALDKAATRDSLTGILNRHAFMDKAATLCDTKAGRLAFLMLDIDHFKSVNDRYGHAGGDQALKCFTATVTAHLRLNDVFGRVGGEEFAVIAMVDSDRSALLVAERLLQAVRRASIRLADGTALSVTVSIGLVIKDAPLTVSLDAALSEADEALYCAKRDGRNRIVVNDLNPA